MSSYSLWLAKLLTLIVVIVGAPIVLCVLISLAVGTGGPAVAVIELTGVIQDSHEVVSELYKQGNDSKIKAIVLRVDSPGGAVGPSQEIYEAVKKIKAKKPIVASMGSMAASGGLYASAGASKILCQLGTQTGSIGVILQIPNVRQIADKVGLAMLTVKSGSMKDVGNMFREMQPEERQYLEETTAKIHEVFIEAVASGRGLKVEDVKKFADGRVVLGSDAKALGLVDGFGDVYDAAKMALQLANVELEADQLPHMIYVNRKDGFFDRLAQTAASFPKQVMKNATLNSPEWMFVAQ